jgi:hypothetical protein
MMSKLMIDAPGIKVLDIGYWDIWIMDIEDIAWHFTVLNTLPFVPIDHSRLTIHD